VARDRVGAIYSVGFDNQLARRMWMLNRYSKGTQHGYGVSVSEMDPQRRVVRRILASEAWRQPAGGWVFANGRESTFAPESGEMLSSRPFTQLAAPKYSEDPELMLLIDRKAVDLSINQLRRLIDHLEVEHSPKAVQYAVRYFGLIADTLWPLVVVAIAIPFAVSGVRVNPAVGVSKSIGLFFLYYVISTVAQSLATHGVIDPVFAAWLPNLGMSLLALWFFVRLR
jgi:lipopolysaccharide export system permease protein